MSERGETTLHMTADETGTHTRSELSTTFSSYGSAQIPESLGSEYSWTLSPSFWYSEAISKLSGSQLGQVTFPRGSRNSAAAGGAPGHLSMWEPQEVKKEREAKGEK